MKLQRALETMVEYADIPGVELTVKGSGVHIYWDNVLFEVEFKDCETVLEHIRALATYEPRSV